MGFIGRQAQRWPLQDPLCGQRAPGAPGPKLGSPGIPTGARRTSRTAYSGMAAELGRRLHRVQLDDLLALLAECFAQFPHGTYVLSGSQFEI
jgi:hypothetical protein